MKIHVETGERAEVIIPSRHPSNGAVMIATDTGQRVAQILVEDGLISEVVEYVVRRRPLDPTEDRLTLWAHIVCRHASCVGLDMSLNDLVKIHDHEHRGPGTIRNHDLASRDADIATLIHVLSEADDGVLSMTDNQLRAHAKLVEREVKRREDENKDEPYEGSFREAADNEGARIAAQSREGGDD
jgi:hypothetical protein